MSETVYVPWQVYGPAGAAADMVATHGWHVARALGNVYDVGLSAAQHLAQVPSAHAVLDGCHKVTPRVDASWYCGSEGCGVCDI